MRTVRALAGGVFCLLALAVSSHAQIDVITNRYDSARTGSNLQETVLNVSNVNSSQFGFLYSYPVDGSIYAQPLYVAQLRLPDLTVHNVVYVATMNDKLYAFDADTNGPPLWTRDFTNSAAGVTPIPIADIVGSNTLNIVGNVGIEGTPAIDLSAKTMYFVARTKENGTYVQRLHAIDITTGADKSGSPVVIQASVSGSANDAVNGMVPFNSKMQQQRVALVLANGLLVIGWGSHEDFLPYHGWLMAYDPTTLSQVGVFCTTPNGYEGGIWQAGRAPVIDPAGNLYYQTGNGGWDGVTEFSDSVLKFSVGPSGLTLLDWFTPSNQNFDNVNDIDLGSSGAMLIPNTNVLVGGGKGSVIYLLNSENLGHFTSTDSTALQTLGAPDAIFNGPAFWNGPAGPLVYLWAGSQLPQAYLFNGTNPGLSPFVAGSTLSGGSPAGALTISANGSTAGTGILWGELPTSQNNFHGLVAGMVRALNAQTLQELWNSDMVPARDRLGTLAKFVVPLVVNGRVYAPTVDGVLRVYGLLTASTTPDFNIIAGSTPQTVAPGATASYPLTVGSLNGFNGTVGLSASGLPGGATAAFTPPSVGGGAGASTLQIVTTSSTPPGSYPVTVTGTSGTLAHNVTAQLLISGTAQGATAIGIDFVGNGTAMAPSELAGVVAKGNWNVAGAAASSTALALVDENGAATGATASWHADNVWGIPITDPAGNFRMMRGYLDTGAGNPTVVSVSNLPASGTGYDVYVYVDGDNGFASRAGNYQISGTGITTATIGATDAVQTNFSGTFTQANGSAGNYVRFTINAAGFTLTATPGTTSDGTPRASVNGIQIVPSAGAAPDFSVGAGSTPQTVAPGATASYPVTVTSVGGFSGTVTLSASGLPSGATASFGPTLIRGGAGASTLQIATNAATPTGTYSVTVTGTSGTLVHSAAVQLVVSGGTPDFSITAAPGTQSVAAGVAASYTATVAAVNSFSGTVALSASGLPSGATATFTPPSVSGGAGASALQIATTAATPIGSYTVTVTGTSGTLVHSTTVQLVVTGTPDFNITVAPGTRSVAAGVAASYTATIAAVNSFSGTVGLSASGLPSGASATFTPPSVSGGAGTSAVQIATTAATPIGNYTVTVTGTSGALVHSATVQLVVTGTPDFSITAAPGTQSVVAGVAASYTATVAAVNSFSGTVALSASGLPSGATATFTPPSVSGGAGTSALQIATTAATPIGSYTVTVTGTSGALVHSTAVQLVVTGTPDFSITAAPGTQSVVAGATASYTATVAAVNSFSGAVALSASGLPNGATATFTPPSVIGAGASAVQVATTAATPIGSYTVTVTGTSGALVHSTTVQLVVSGGSPSATVIGINFVGNGTTMAATEVAGVVAKTHWNAASAAASSTALALVDENGAATGATASWHADNVWGIPITDTAGNSRMMRGYLDTGAGNPTVVSVSNLPASGTGYDVYVYVDGDNGFAGRAGNYQISGTGITTATIVATDAAQTNFSGTFTQANGSAGNYVKFTINAAGFTLTATPGTSADGTPRASVNGIQIVPTAGGTSDFSMTAAPGTQSVAAGVAASYTATVAAVNSFSGTVALSASGLPSGTTATFTPPSVSGGAGTSAVQIATTAATPIGSYTVTVTGTSGALVHSTTVQLVVTGTPDFNITVAPGTQSVAAGVAASYTATVAAVNSFSGTVALSASGLPSGATATFTPPSVSGGAGASALQIATTAATPIGSYTVTVTGTSGALVHSTTVQLVVTGTPDFNITVAPATQSVAAGVAASYTATVAAVNSFSGTVALSASGLPSGASATFTPPSVSGGAGASALQIATTAATPIGSYTVTVTGTSGTLVHSTTVQLVVTGTPDFNITVAPGTQSVTAGVAASYTAMVAAVNSFSGAVALSASGLPSGATATFTPPSVSGGAGASALQIATTAATPIGSYTVTVTGTSGTLVHSTTVQLVVTGTPDFNITVAPGTQSVTAGLAASYTATVAAVNSFSGTVALSASGLPSGATATFTPPSVSGGAGTSAVQVATTAATPIGSYTVTVTGTSGALVHSTTVQLVVSGGSPSATVIGINFVGNGTTMAATEVAGVVAKTHWNAATTATRTTALALVDENGAASGATATWHADNVWGIPITDTAGNFRMMRGYLDTGAGNPTVVSVSNLPASGTGYDVYVYVDGDNGFASRAGSYQISGTGITTTAIVATDAAQTNFSGTFTQANGSAGNYVKFTINAAGFTLTATPGTSADGTPRASVNGIQIVPH